jgi:hypothetical protein
MTHGVVPPHCARVLFRVSFLTLVSFCLAARLNLKDGMAVTAAVFMCSINHWRKPVYGVRRNVDVLNTVICGAYQIWRSFGIPTPYTIAYLASTISGIGAFFLGVHLNKTNPEHGTLSHSFVHILGNIGNFCLFLGRRA